MKRIAIDMDDVLAETSIKIIDQINSRLNKSYSHDELLKDNSLKMAFYQDYQSNNQFLWEPGFFLDIAVKDDAVEVVKQLQKKYEVFIVSAATEFPESMKEKLVWLEQHFPFIGWQHTVFCGHKHMIQADYLIDDHEKNLITFSGKPILYSALHNLHIQDYERVNNWKEVAHMFI
ncbi:5' nucleotidase, NT5C type [Aquirufa rosea]|uniref:5'-3'-deoxyribonucleotidase n=1 Tax=Aquirufa rosea TaxID=2509241 RepID=A0A4Q1C235_9BACT|nr:5'-3'-deoxyribonucleotidase [Aquirufa rosea]RXK52217.1 5'-3'-deoxyribonucleotidase [Aquirufa rosea]